QITTAVLAQLAEVLTSIGAAADYDPFGSPITAATALSPGNAADQLLDVVKVVTDPGSGKLALTTIDNPSPVLLASATSSGSVLPAPAPEVITLSAAAQFVAQRFTACFALTAAQRALAVDTTLPASQGGPAVTSLAIECQDLTAAATTAAGIDFRDNGYSAGQWLYTLLTSD